jgi:phosphate transport system substrate-binding protein
LIAPAKRFGTLAAIAVLVVGACSSAATPTPPAPTAAPPASAPASAGGASAPASAPAGSAAAPASAAPNCVAGSIIAGGSTALQPLVTAAGKAYQAACAGSTINVQPGGSGTGLTNVASGAFQIGNSDVTAESKLATPDAALLVDHVVARQGWLMVTNTSVTGVTNLSTQQMTDIWTGKDTNWNQVGGNDQPIVLILRPASSGTRATFKKIVLGGADEANTGTTLTEDSNGAVTTAVKATPGSTSVIGFAYYAANKSGLVGLQLDGVDATVDNMTNGTYKLQAFGHMYTKGAPTGLTDAFLQFMLSPYVQNGLIPSLFYAPAGS